MGDFFDQCLEGGNKEVRLVSLLFLSKAATHERARHMPTVVGLLRDSDTRIRDAAWSLFAKSAAERVPHLSAIAGLLNDADSAVRRTAASFFANCSPEERAPYHGAIADSHLNLEVLIDGEPSVFFKVKRSGRLQKMIDAYCSRQALEPDLVFFTFGGRQIKPMDTASSLGMEDGDTIQAKLNFSVEAAAQSLFRKCSANERAPFEHMLDHCCASIIEID